MTTKYSRSDSGMISRTIEDEDGIRKYIITKLAAEEVSREAFKILRAVVPSFGSAIDSFINGDEEDIFNDNSKTFSEMLFFLSENLSDDHYSTLVNKLLGSMSFNNKEIEDWSDHFDDYEQDFIEILIWAGRENFEGFFTKSTMLAPLMKRTGPTFQKIKEALADVLKTQKQDSNEELSETTPEKTQSS